MVIPLLQGAPLIGANHFYQAIRNNVNPNWFMMDAANEQNLGVILTGLGSPLPHINFPQNPEFNNINANPVFPPFLPGLPRPGPGRSGLTFGFDQTGNPLLQRPGNGFGLTPNLTLPTGFDASQFLPIPAFGFGGFSPLLIPQPQFPPFGLATNPPPNIFFDPSGFTQTPGFPTFNNGNFIPLNTGGAAAGLANLGVGLPQQQAGLANFGIGIPQQQPMNFGFAQQPQMSFGLPFIGSA